MPSGLMLDLGTKRSSSDRLSEYFASAARMLSSGSSLSSLRAVGTKADEMAVSHFRQGWALPLTDGVGGWDPAKYDKPGKDFKWEVYVQWYRISGLKKCFN